MIRLPSLLLGLAAAVFAAPQDAPKPGTDTRPQTGADTRPAVVRTHPQMGVTVDAERLDKEGVAKVVKVVPNSPAQAAGVQVGDEILSVAGVRIVNDGVYRRTMLENAGAPSLKVVVRRGAPPQATELDLTVAVGAWKREPPQTVAVQHCLISFKDAKSVANGAKRTREEALQLAKDILARVNAGEDFGAIIKTTTDDAGSRTGDPPGQYVLYDKTPVPGVPGARPRDGMVPGFGYVAFALAVGETQIVPYDPEVSPFGFHVVRRTQ